MNGYFVRKDILEKLDQMSALNERLRLLKGQGAESEEIRQEIIAIEDTIESLEYDITELADHLTRNLCNLEIDADAYRKEANKWMEKALATDYRIKKEKELLKYILESNGITKLKAGLFQLTVANNGGKVPIRFATGVLPEDLPDEFRKEVVSYKPDDAAIRAFLDGGGKSELFQYGERGTNLRIR